MRPAVTSGTDKPDHIVKAAIEEFLERGYQESSIEGIARRAVAGKQTIYRYFTDKEDLFVHVVERMQYYESFNEQLPFNKSLAPEQILFEMSQRYQEAVLHPNWRNAFRLNISIVSYFPEIADRLHLARLARNRRVVKYLKELSDRNFLNAADIELATRQFGFLSIESLRVGMGFPARSPSQRDEVARRVVRLFLFGHRAACDQRRHRVSQSENLTDEASYPTPQSCARPAPKSIFISADRLDQILDVAGAEFFREGYRRGSVNRIAEVANTPKTTIYRHFTNKDGLFIASMLRTLAKLPVTARKWTDDSRAPSLVITDIARAFLDAFLDPLSIQLYRTVIAEVNRFPELAQKIYCMASKELIESAAEYISRLSEQEMPLGDHALWSARQLMVLAINGNVYIATQIRPTDAEKAKLASDVAHVFMNGYATQPAK